MRNLLIALTGFLVGAGAVLAVIVVVPESTSASSKPTQAKLTAQTRYTNMPMASSRIGSMGSGGMSSMGSGRMNATGSGIMTVASLPVRKLMIQHVQRGCHVWSDGTTTGPMMSLRLKQGQKLQIMDMDVDAHQMMQFSGPTHLMMGGPMMMNHGWTLTFTKKGVYHLGTKTVEMPGGMDVKTTGPDNKLRLDVTVA